MNSRFSRAAVSVALVLPVAAIIALAWSIRVDAPLPDDVDAILRFANDSAAAESSGERLRLLLEPHVDHRIITTRFLVALELATLGSVDFRLLSMLSVAALLALPALVSRLAKRPNCPIDAIDAFATLSVVWLVVQPQSFDALVSPTAAANVLVLPLAGMVALSLRRGTRGGLVAGAGFALVAQFTQGNGVLVLPAAFVSLVLAGRRGDARRWAVVSVFLAFVFFTGFASRSGAEGLEPSEWGRSAVYALAFAGSAGGFGSGEASVAVGAALLLFLGLGRWLDQPVDRSVPASSGPVDARVSRDATGTAFRVIEGHLRATGLDASHIMVFIVLEGEKASAIVSARTGVRVAGRRPRGSIPFRSIFSSSELPPDAEATGLIVSDGSFESFASFAR